MGEWEIWWGVYDALGVVKGRGFGYVSGSTLGILWQGGGVVWRLGFGVWGFSGGDGVGEVCLRGIGMR